MNIRFLLLFATFCVIPTCVMAEGCDVETRSSSASVPTVSDHSCYEYEGMPVNSIDWSCSNESKDMVNAVEKKVQQCDDHYQATCIATLTQESLANPHSTSKDKNANALNVPDGAQVTTYYYGAENLGRRRLIVRVAVGIGRRSNASPEHLFYTYIEKITAIIISIISKKNTKTCYF